MELGEREMRNYFKVYRNGILVGETESASKKNAIRFMREGRVKIGTHMGEWRRKVNGYLYETTVGVTVDFVRFGRGKV